MARCVQGERASGAGVEHGDGQAAGAWAPQQRDVEAIRSAVSEFSHDVLLSGRKMDAKWKASASRGSRDSEVAGVSGCGEPSTVVQAPVLHHGPPAGSAAVALA